MSPESQSTGNCTFTKPSYCYDAEEVKTEGEHNIVNQVKRSSAVRETQSQVFTRHDAPVTRSYPCSLPMDSKFTPSRQIKKFSGESLDYHRFMVDFNHRFYNNKIAARTDFTLCFNAFLTVHIAPPAARGVNSQVIYGVRSK